MKSSGDKPILGNNSPPKHLPANKTYEINFNCFIRVQVSGRVFVESATRFGATNAWLPKTE